MPLVRKRAIRQLRTTQRFPIDLPASLRAGYQSHAIRIADISAEGAKLRCSVTFPLHAPVTLEIGSDAIEAQVIWCSDSSCGLRFAHAVSPLEIVRRNLPALRTIFGTSTQSRHEPAVPDPTSMYRTSVPRTIAE